MVTVLDRYGHLYATDSDRTTDRLAALFVGPSEPATVTALKS